MAYQTLNLDLSKSSILKPIVYGRIGDADMQTVTVNVTSRDVPVNLTGYTITFEGVTSGDKTKVFDTAGIKPKDLTKGIFEYTFPNMAFAVAGRYETAYFSIVKGSLRDTTVDFDITIYSNADIDAEEAKTIITEYNKLVEELHAITDKYVADSDKKFADINKKIVDIQSQITEYQANVKKTADDAVAAIDSSVSTAVSTVNTSSNAAIKAVNDALEEFKAGDFYTKSETDAKFKAVNDLIVSQDIPEGANLDDYKKEGEFSKKTPTVVTGAPEEVTGAFRLSVRSMVGSSGIFQTLYDYATRAIYYRIGNTSLGFNLPWQRIANNSEVVHLTGDEEIKGDKKFLNTLTAKAVKEIGDTEWASLALETGFSLTGDYFVRCRRKGNIGMVQARAVNSTNPFVGNTYRSFAKLPEGLIPLNSVIKICGEYRGNPITCFVDQNGLLSVKSLVDLTALQTSLNFYFEFPLD